ncbi:MAG: hypothetical protein LC808_29230 [Actinobacteria bacterium]|nr:hypothetical protein [Actinomycetota bacterium]
MRCDHWDRKVTCYGIEDIGPPNKRPSYCIIEIVISSEQLMESIQRNPGMESDFAEAHPGFRIKQSKACGNSRTIPRTRGFALARRLAWITERPWLGEGEGKSVDLLTRPIKGNRIRINDPPKYKSVMERVEEKSDLPHCKGI